MRDGTGCPEDVERSPVLRNRHLLGTLAVGLALATASLQLQCGGQTDGADTTGAGPGTGDASGAGASARGPRAASGGAAGAAGAGSSAGGALRADGGSAQGSGAAPGVGGTGHQSGGTASTTDAGGALQRDAGSDEPLEAGAPSYLGFRCGMGQTCVPGERCVECGHVGSYAYRCVPRPDLDPPGYQAAVADCDQERPEWGRECDGPEDCQSDEYCSAARLQCSSTPTPPPAFCCFWCDSLPLCDYCRTDDDCPEDAVCVWDASFQGLGACLRRTCEVDAECPTGRTCVRPATGGETGYCHQPCAATEACPVGQTCSDGYCL